MRGVHGGVGTIYLDLQLTWPGNWHDLTSADSAAHFPEVSILQSGEKFGVALYLSYVRTP